MHRGASCAWVFLLALTAADILLLETLLAAPKSVTSGAESITNHDPAALIKALRELRAADENDEATDTAHRGLRFTQLVSPGCGG